MPRGKVAKAAAVADRWTVARGTDVLGNCRPREGASPRRVHVGQPAYKAGGGRHWPTWIEFAKQLGFAWMRYNDDPVNVPKPEVTDFCPAGMFHFPAVVDPAAGVAEAPAAGVAEAVDAPAARDDTSDDEAPVAAPVAAGAGAPVPPQHIAFMVDSSEEETGAEDVPAKVRRPRRAVPDGPPQHAKFLYNSLDTVPRIIDSQAMRMKKKGYNMVFFTTGLAAYPLRDYSKNKATQMLKRIVPEQHPQVDRVDIAVHALDIPRARRVPIGHCGEHYDNLKAFLSNPYQVKAWGDRFRIEVARLGFNEDHRVVVACRQGRHRSVTVCRFLMYMARKLGYHVVGPWHLQKPNWGHLCDRCPLCKVDTHMKDDLMDYYAAGA